MKKFIILLIPCFIGCAAPQDTGTISLQGGSINPLPFQMRVVTKSKGMEWWMWFWPPAAISRTELVDDATDETYNCVGEVPKFPERIGSCQFYFLIDNMPISWDHSCADLNTSSQAILDTLLNATSNFVPCVKDGLVSITVFPEATGWTSKTVVYERKKPSDFDYGDLFEKEPWSKPKAELDMYYEDKYQTIKSNIVAASASIMKNASRCSSTDFNSAESEIRSRHRVTFFPPNNNNQTTCFSNNLEISITNSLP
jgi:hypothetical protein